MKLLASVGLQPTTLEGDDTVRIAYGGGGGGDIAGVRPALETQLSSKALKAKDLYQGGCMAPWQRFELRTLACLPTPRLPLCCCCILLPFFLCLLLLLFVCCCLLLLLLLRLCCTLLLA
jgi:hypothetical protein